MEQEPLIRSRFFNRSFGPSIEPLIEPFVLFFAVDRSIGVRHSPVTDCVDGRHHVMASNDGKAEVGGPKAMEGAIVEGPGAEGDDEDDEDEDMEQGEPSQQPSGSSAAGAPGRGEAQDEYESKRRKRLELNRKAAQESRRRKKLRIEELQRSVVFLTRENSELREQNELLRQMLASEMPVESSTNVDRYQAENTALKLALYESVNSSLQRSGKQGASPNRRDPFD